MASVKLPIVIYSDRPWTNGLVKRRYQVTLTDNLGTDHIDILMPVKVIVSDDGSAAGAAHLEGRRVRERGNEDITALWNPLQADYDRRSLGYAMTVESTDEFYTYLPLFDAVVVRGGANDLQRAAYLGVSDSEYGLMSARFNDVKGIEFFLVDAKDAVWKEIPEGWS